ncbi:MAG: DNA primase [Candidatus Eremiobacteraeota bacterium]|nr:DNA primase [Candidatus Eremiobacteraeota bacterium]
MARIDDGVKREVLARTDIATYIGTYVQLRKRGNDLVGLCPFHGEKTPSFHVHPDRNFWKCFGCQKGGDAIAFAMEQEALSFPEALRSLARRAGVAIEDEDPAAARVRSEKEQIYAANDVAAAFFHRTLRFAPEAEIARAYANERGLLPATIESFKLGFAPASWDALVRELTQNGVDLEVAARAGLLKRGDRGFYDVYRGRLMVPTYASTTGEIVAFGGRALDDSEPKYLNTSTTPVYTKGRGLYALNVARRAAVASDALVVVEGYLDCIALHQAGFANAVASLGTAFTAEQAAELRKYAERIFLCFDADSAGDAATVKSIDVLSAAGCVPFVVQLPPGDDPDTFVRKSGAPAFQGLLDAALE